MQTYIDCVYCYLKQAVNCMKIAGTGEDRQYEILFALMNDIKLLDRKNSPAVNSTKILLRLYRLLNDNDPYKEIKKRTNDLAMGLYPGLQDIVNRSKDRLSAALKTSVSGNVIDLGINRHFDIGESLQYSLKAGFSKDDYNLFVDRLSNVNHVIIVGDNAGEIVFDRLLVEELSSMGKMVTYIVKGGPVLNDATMEDALQVGMNKVATVITTGINYLGVPLQVVSKEVRDLLKDAGLVIAKGQANFESLEHEDLSKDKVFFLLKIKCECLARDAEAEFGDVVFFCRKS